MCGIIGFIGNEPAASIVLQGLQKLEYRGYDSAGLATINHGKLELKKDEGRIEEIVKNHRLDKLPGNLAVAHIRWATHGSINRKNAHPHVDCTNQIAVVHNGTIDNYLEMLRNLESKGHVFISETDTEVIPHLLEDYLNEGSTFDVTLPKSKPSRS